MASEREPLNVRAEIDLDDGATVTVDSYVLADGRHALTVYAQSGGREREAQLTIRVPSLEAQHRLLAALRGGVA